MAEQIKNSHRYVFLAFGLFMLFGQSCILVENGCFQAFGQILITLATACGWLVFVFCQPLRFLAASVGVLAFSIWLIFKGVDALSHNPMPSKETAFVIAVGALVWLAISCYSLSLLKDSQSENEDL